MKTANPVEKDNKSHQSKGKKQSPKDSVVIPLSEVDVVRTQTQQSRRNGSVGATSGLQNIYDQGSEIMNGKFQNSLAKTGDINHPQTKVAEKSYMATTSIDQARDYNDGKSGTYLPKTVQEQAVAYQGSKNSTGVIGTVKQATAKSTSGKSGIVPVEQPKSLPADDVVEMNSEVKTPASAKDNPGFMELSGNINTTAKLQKRHESAPKASNDAQAAAPSPSNERESMAQAGQVNVMDEQQPGTFSKNEFKALLTAKIKGIKLPANEAEADEFEKNNNIQEVNKNAMGDVKNEKNAASHDIADATAKKPDITGQPVRSVAKMPTPNVGKAPGIPSVAKAMPVKRDAASVEKPIQEQTASIDNEMKANGVTDSMLANSNEPSFTKALAEKNNAKTQSAAATQQFRKTEGSELAKTKEEAQSQAVRQISGMHSARKGGLDHAHGEQKQTATKDSQKRKEIADRINSIYNSSKTDVDGILNNLDKSVAEKFDRGSKVAKKAFEDHVHKEMEAYKVRRYRRAGMSYGAMAALGLLVWDKLTSLPDEVNKYFDSGKELYIKVMDRYIDDIATHVTTQLNAAKTRIAKGKKDVQTYVDSLSPSLRKIGKEAITEIQKKFNALEESVNSKKDALIDTLAKKYADNVAGIDARITELKSQNSGLINKALDVLKTSVFAIIIEIKNTLTNLLSGVIEAIQAIITDPIGFFRNLIAGVSQGFTNFGANIWTHLKTGFFGWLTGAMKGVSLIMPEDVFSLKGVFSITTQVLGLTWNGIRAIGARVIGEPVMKVFETGFEMVQIVRKEGVAGLWEHLKDQFADLKETVMDAIMDIIQNQVIQAGIKWVMGLLTPVGAFIKAAMAIIDVVKFFIQRAAQIMELVKAFTDSIKAIASGNVGAVAKAIENALGKAVPVLIGFLASLLGIGGLADKVVGVIRKIRQRIENAIVKFWNFVKAKGSKLLGRLGIGQLGKKKEKVDDKHLKNMDSEVAPEPFTMNGEKHTLMFENGEIYMASEKGTLTSKLTKFKNYVSKKPNADEFEGKGFEILDGIEDLQRRNDRVKKDLNNAKNRVDSPEKVKKMKEAEANFDGLSKDIQNFGERFKLEDLISSSKKTKYKPEKIEFIAGEKQITVKYFYDVEVNGRNATRTFEGSYALVRNNLVEQKTIGYNLVTKESGSRSYTVSANQVDSNEAIEHLKKNPEEQIEFNASHILADLFLGSGYKATLNLVTASGHYNKEIMKEAEDRLQRELSRVERKFTGKNSSNYVTFDIRITAIWKELVDNSITSKLAELNPNIDQELLKSMHKILARNVDPKLVQSVVYEVIKAKINGTKEKTHDIRPIKIGADDALQKILK
ncbi:phage tail protein [Chryseobacterium artocarpi]|uniref:phage tail protein n=1 Tax=Chryseobacterium artocarpi TaxID=1414727 RepID=UPI003F325D6B